MKKLQLFLAAGLIAISSISLAQTNKRASVKNYLQYGEIDKAKEKIEQVVVHDKTKLDPLSWFYRARVYHAIYNIDSYKKADRRCEAEGSIAEFRKLDPNPLPKSIESYKKALLYSVKGINYDEYDLNKNVDRLKFMKLLQDPSTRYNDQQTLGFILAQYLPILHNTVYNDGINAFEKKDYKKALELFKDAELLLALRGETDTVAINSAAYAALNAKNTEETIKYFKKLRDINYGKDDNEKGKIYYFLAKAYLSKQDTAKYLKTLKKGRKKAPKSSVLLAETINYYITTNKTKEAKDMLLLATKTDPNNKLLYFNLGTIYEKEDSLNKAIEMYKKSIELDPNYTSGLYNLGALYNNNGAKLVKEADDIPPTEQKKYEAKLNEANNEFKKALPYLEKVHQLDPKDMATKVALKGIYYSLKMMDKYEAINKEVKGQ
jgi:tetratricopeptide (TPR) repeat protein